MIVEAVKPRLPLRLFHLHIDMNRYIFVTIIITEKINEEKYVLKFQYYVIRQ
jgi:hypothetical protein